MRRLSEALTVLIATSEDIMRRPQMLQSSLPPAFAELAAELRRADNTPCENVRTTRAAIVMITAIEEFFAEEADHHWQMLIGATLPLLRREAWQALRNEREQMAQEDFRR